jgi:hypothetical protein
MTRDDQRKYKLILGAAFIGAVLVAAILICVPKFWWLALVFAWICSIALALVAILPPRTSSFRAAKLVTLWLTAANLFGIVFLTYPYWSGWLEGRFFYGTIVSMWMYGLLAAAWGFCAIVVVFTTVSSHRLFQLLMLGPGFVAMTLVGKWVLILAVGMEPFHNRMGLGMEIFAFLPNLVIDGLLVLSATASTLAAFVLKGFGSSRVVSQRR